MERLAHLIDNTLLAPDASPEQINALCDASLRLGCASVCVSPLYVLLAARRLAGSSVKVCTVIGFPSGASTTATKAFEAADAVKNGADELDMVLPIGLLKSGDDEAVRQDVKAVVQAAAGRIVKVILETCLLNDEQIVRACRLCREAGAGFVKTSTGFSSGGATEHAVSLMAQTVGGSMGVKASGGIRTRAQALAFLAAGATRIGASRTEEICRGEAEPEGK